MMLWTSTSNAPALTRKDDLWLWPYENGLEATPLSTEEAMVWQYVRVSGEGKYQNEGSTNARTGPKRMEEADVTLYAEQNPAGDVSRVIFLLAKYTKFYIFT